MGTKRTDPDFVIESPHTKRVRVLADEEGDNDKNENDPHGSQSFSAVGGELLHSSMVDSDGLSSITENDEEEEVENARYPLLKSLSILDVRPSGVLMGIHSEARGEMVEGGEDDGEEEEEEEEEEELENVRYPLLKKLIGSDVVKPWGDDVVDGEKEEEEEEVDEEELENARYPLLKKLTGSGGVKTWDFVPQGAIHDDEEGYEELKSPRELRAARRAAELEHDVLEVYTGDEFKEMEEEEADNDDDGNEIIPEPEPEPSSPASSAAASDTPASSIHEYLRYIARALHFMVRAREHGIDVGGSSLEELARVRPETWRALYVEPVNDLETRALVWGRVQRMVETLLELPVWEFCLLIEQAEMLEDDLISLGVVV